MSTRTGDPTQREAEGMMAMADEEVDPKTGLSAGDREFIEEVQADAEQQTSKRGSRGKGEADEELQMYAQEDYGKDYSELSTSEKQHCAGRKGQAHRNQYEEEE